jgi:rifampicin phosphotransferase
MEIEKSTPSNTPIGQHVPYMRFGEVGLDQRTLGGKAYGLARLAQAGLPVPEGIILQKEPLNDQDWTSIQSWWTSVGLKPLAVRSSYEAEDSGDLSFAGQNKSFLNIQTLSELKEATSQCFASVHSQHSKEYRQHFGVDGSKKQMNVVLQIMIEPLFSGVYFDEDPQGKGWLIEYVRGYGEDLVSGRKTPFRCKETGGEQTSHSKWQTDYTQKVVATGDAVARELKFAPDMEWAIDQQGVFYVLQARPITTDNSNNRQGIVQKELERLRHNYDKDTVWDSQTFAEWTGFPSYLTFSIWRLAFSPDFAFSRALQAFGYRGFNTQDFGKKNSVLERVFGRAYVNLDKLCSLYFGDIPYRIVAYPRARLVFDFKKLSLKAFIKTPLSIYRMLKVSWLLSTQKKVILDRCRQALLQFKGDEQLSLQPEFYKTLPSKDLLQLFTKESRKFAEEHLYWPFKLIILTESSLSSVHTLLRSIFGEEKSWHMIKDWMSRGIHTSTYEMNRLYVEATHKVELRSDFIKQYGHRGPGELDLAYPRWMEQNDIFSGTHLQWQASTPSVESVEDDIKKFDTIKKDLLLQEWALLKAMLELRESWKMQILKPYGALRLMALEISKRFGLGDDIFWLRLSEIENFATENGLPQGASQWISERKQRFDAFKFYQFPEKMSLADMTSYLDENAVQTSAVLNGRALSPGLCHGRVRIVNDISDAQSEEWPEDTILVAEATDPGWTPLFVKARGIVVSRGGSLSHCAIVAREMRKPAVAGITHATRILKNDMRICVDGDHGRVIIES